jgi:hypothetical protein
MCGIEGGCAAPSGLAKKIGGDSLTQGVALGFAGAPPWGCECCHRLGLRTAIKKSERKGRRSFDTAIEYGTVAMMAREKTRTAKPAVRATGLYVSVTALYDSRETG